MKSKSRSLGASAKRRPRSSGVPSAKKPTASRPSDRLREEEKARAERHALYKRMLVASATTKRGGFCWMLAWDLNEDVLLRDLPELMKHKPRGLSIHEHWWTCQDWEPRIKALKAAIKASAPALGIVAKPKAARPRAVAKRSGAKPGRKAATPKKNP